MGKIRIIEQGYTQEERFKEVDENTKATIKTQYDLEDEIKLLRRTIMAIATQLDVKLPKEFLDYNIKVEDAVSQSKNRKSRIKTNKIQIRQREI